MKPIAVFRHYVTEGPGYFATYLDRHRLPWTMVKVDEGQPIPPRADAFSGLVFMGGPMSVNDDLPWLPPALALIREAVARDVPVLGHCLGGQLMSKALGGRVSRNPVREIGWGEVRVEDQAAAQEWFGTAAHPFLTFHWHGETFSVPEDATRVLSSPWCENQAFVLGPHLGLQCHIEMTEELLRTWCGAGAREIAAHCGPSVQSVDAILEELETRLSQLHAVADRVYGKWVQRLRG